MAHATHVASSKLRLWFAHGLETCLRSGGSSCKPTGMTSQACPLSEETMMSPTDVDRILDVASQTTSGLSVQGWSM